MLEELDSCHRGSRNVVETQLMAEYWDADLLDLSDELNREIWERSPQIQVGEIGPPVNYGAQQAMIGSGVVLPWPPDMVGKSCSTGGKLIVCGSAYAGFISPFSGRNGHSMSVDEYQQPTVDAFQRVFVNNVVRGGDRYYGVLEALLQDISALDQTLVLDLCRVSFVEKEDANGVRIDRSGDGVVTTQEARAVFETYVEAPTPSSWTWKRLSGRFGTRILALGSIAEHGLLRLFAKQGMDLFIDEVGPVRFDTLDPRCASGEWVRYYAGDLMTVGGKRLRKVFGTRVTLQYWIDSGAWWTIRNPDNPDLSWRLLPAFHPTSQSSTKLNSTRALLRRMLI